jgi:hypothetical protein
MLTQTRTDIAALVPGPSELLPGCPDAIIDLQTEAGVELVGGHWRYADARVSEIDFVEVGHPADPLGPGLEPNRTFDVEPTPRARTTTTPGGVHSRRQRRSCASARGACASTGTGSG